MDDRPIADHGKIEPEAIVDNVYSRLDLRDSAPELPEELRLVRAEPGDRFLRLHRVGENNQADADDPAESGVETGLIVVFVLLRGFSGGKQVGRLLLKKRDALKPRPFLFGHLDRLNVE